MNALVVFDSRYGHTEQIAQAIGGAIGCRVRKAAGVDPAGLTHLDLLILGSPTHGGWFTPAIREMLEVWPALDGLQAAAFDTRTDTIWNRILRFGYAAPRLARALEDKGPGSWRHRKALSSWAPRALSERVSWHALAPGRPGWPARAGPSPATLDDRLSTSARRGWGRAGPPPSGRRRPHVVPAPAVLGRQPSGWYQETDLRAWYPIDRRLHRRSAHDHTEWRCCQC